MRTSILAVVVVLTSGCAGGVLKNLARGTAIEGELACEGELQPVPGIHVLRAGCKTIAEWSDATACTAAEARTGVPVAECLEDVKVKPVGPTLFHPLIGGYRPTETPGFFTSPKRLVRIYDAKTLTEKFGPQSTMRELGEKILAHQLEPASVSHELIDQLQEDGESRFFFSKRVTQLNNLALETLTGQQIEVAAAEIWLAVRLSQFLTEARKFDIDLQVRRLPQGRAELTKLANTPPEALYALLHASPPLPELASRVPEWEKPAPPDTRTLEIKPLPKTDKPANSPP